ncbi:hypothetical protein FJTKL_01072 [Diaporthe vaccinii]|uniref:Chromatin remodeling factor mit1 n=1 Tax=Diaporthe vaccinii TaxID=105482 RepID=A0ABR4F4X2_9PEZI
MEETQNAEEDLLAFLQPLTMPDEFTFESRNRHLEDSSDDVDQEPIPGPAPPAPMAPMAPTAPVAPMAPMDPIDPIEPAVPLAPEAAMIEPKGVANVPPPETNGHKEEKTVVEQDDDAIEYETPKATRKSPAKRSIRSRAAPKARRDDGDQSPHESAAELLKRFGTSSAKKRVEAKPHSENDIEVNGRSPVKSGTRKTREATVESAGFEAESSPDPWKFEVVIKPLPPAATQEYIKVPPGDEVYRVLAVIKTDIPGEAWLSVEFEDGRVDQVALDQLSSYPNGRQALAYFRKPKNMDSDPDDYQIIDGTRRSKKRKAATQDPDYEGNMDVDEDDAMMDDLVDIDEDDDYPFHPGHHRMRQKMRNLGPSSRTRGSDRNRELQPQPDYAVDDYQSDDESDRKRRSKRSLRKNVGAFRSKALSSQFDDDIDELQNDEDGRFRVTSDIVPERKSRRRGGNGRLRRGRPSLFANRDDDDDIAFEPPVRRSDRKNKNSVMMAELGWEDETYAPEDDKVPAAPKASGAKETFASTPDGPFKQSHCTTCDTCGNGPIAPNKGIMIYCQGCAMGYHKTCLGFRSTRDHLVTKVGPDQFVLQCRHCIGVRKKKDFRAPSLEICQVCREKGRACDAFAPKRSALQEQKLREENDGQDPIVPVDPKLINNAANVLFRCINCHCAYHFEHLPPSHNHRMAGGDIRADRLAKYSVYWKCRNCLDMTSKIDTLVAWRPTDRDAYLPGQTTLDVIEDAKEYLVKYESQSYAHCEWKPGPWVFGVTNGVMRNAFPKRNEGANLLPKFDEKDAIPEEYLLSDVVLDVRYKGTFKFESKKADLDKVFMIDEALIKFEGLDYVDAVWDAPPDHDSGLRWDSFLSAYNEFLNGKHFKFEPASSIKERLREFRRKDFSKGLAFKDDPPSSEPRFNGFLREGNTLMKYQVQGLNWILSSFHQERSAVLADEMGLGKTIQVIALMASVSLQSPRAWPWLVVVPNSTCPNWRREIKKWAPDMRVVCYHGGKEPQRLAYQYELFPNGSRDMKAHVVIMSYDSAQDDHTRNLFRSVQWVGMIVDEGQRLKNDENLLYSALRSMRVPWRLLLTGTPLQNNKRELFNLLQFIDPSKNAERLDEQFAELTKDNITELHEMIKPYFLRRTKATVLKFLPPMAQIILPVSMSIVQEKLCKSIMERNPELIRAIFANTKLKSNERSSLNNILMQLRKCLGHPFLYSGAVEDKNVDEKTMHRNLVEASAKFVLLEQMLPRLQEHGHRVLIFSQFLGMLDIVEDFLTGIGFKYHRLDGSVTSLERQKRIDSFNEPGSEYFAFLLSTRAGGVGINLATADTVIILDPDFNPHQDLQALSRAHRIGQKNKVLCFQLMTKGSVEEKIMQIGRKKMALDHALVESMDAKNGKDGEVAEDLESILKHGAEALFNDGEKEQIKYDAAAIEKLLDRSAIKPTIAADDEEGDAKKSSFQYARVWQNDSGDLANELQVEENPEVPMSVWDEILKQREDEAKRRAELNKEVLGRGGRRRQTVKYAGEAVDGLEDQPVGAIAETKLTSEVDEDFISSDPSDSDSEDGNVDSGMNSQGQAKKAFSIEAIYPQKAPDAPDHRSTPKGPDTPKHKDPVPAKRPRGRPRKNVDGQVRERKGGGGDAHQNQGQGQGQGPGHGHPPRGEQPGRGRGGRQSGRAPRGGYRDFINAAPSVSSAFSGPGPQYANAFSGRGQTVQQPQQPEPHGDAARQYLQAQLPHIPIPYPIPHFGATLSQHGNYGYGAVRPGVIPGNANLQNINGGAANRPQVPPVPPVRPSSIGPLRSNGTSSGSSMSRTQFHNLNYCLSLSHPNQPNLRSNNRSKSKLDSLHHRSLKKILLGLTIRRQRKSPSLSRRKKRYPAPVWVLSNKAADRPSNRWLICETGTQRGFSVHVKALSTLLTSPLNKLVLVPLSIGQA